MNTTSLFKPAGLSLGLLFSALMSSNAVAGPGPEYWARVNPKAQTSYPSIWRAKPAIQTPTQAKADAAVSTTKADATPVKLCAGAEVVPLTIMKPAMANGKGPLVSVPVGTKTVCHMCPVTTRFTRNSLPNGKGVPFTTEVTKIGVEHNCANCTGTPAKT